MKNLLTLKNVTTMLTIALAIWWTFLWGILAVFATFGMMTPDVGSLISLRSSWWFVGEVVAKGLFGLWLLWAALRSFKGTLLLTVVIAGIVVGSVYVPGLNILLSTMWPTPLLLPFLWCKHKGTSR